MDTNILMDLLLDDLTHRPESEDALREAARGGALVICEVVYAEMAGLFSEPSQLNDFLREVGIEMISSLPKTLWKAGQLWRKSRKGRTDEPVSARRFLADFLIGAHALLQAERLLTRDQGFYRAAFSGLRLA